MSREEPLFPRLGRATLPCLIALAPWLAACQDNPTGTAVEPPRTSAHAASGDTGRPAAALPDTGEIHPLSLSLPYSGSTSAIQDAFVIVQTGTGGPTVTGRAGVFLINNPSNSSTALHARTLGDGAAILGSTQGGGRAGVFGIFNNSNNSVALEATTNGRGGAGLFSIFSSTNSSPALAAETFGTGSAVYGLNPRSGRAGHFQITNTSNSKEALLGETSGHGTAVLGFTTGTGRGGGFQISNTSNTSPALQGTTDGRGPAVLGFTTGTGEAGFFQITNSSNNFPALHAFTNGGGSPFLANHAGSSGPLAVFQLNGVTKIRFSRTGRGYFSNGTQTGGADVAEAFQVEGEVSEYEPGDVLLISERSDRRVEKAGEAYSTRVLGVYATKPGVLLTERDIDESLEDMLPVGVLGVIPTKVSAENGAIRRGDLLVSAATPGHAMRAEPLEINGIRLYPNGALLGKALQAFEGPGTGVIQVLVNVK